MRSMSCTLPLLLALQPATAFAAGSEAPLYVTGVLLFVLVAITLFILVLPEEERKRMAAGFQRLRTIFLTGTEERVTEFDHEFDGIRELDNRIPPWFTLLFLGTIVFGAVYLVDYHVLGTSKLMAGEYDEEMAAAAFQRRILLASEGTIDEAKLTRLTDAASIGRGGEQFKKYCVSCHGPEAGGAIGPNLTDDYWIHGGGIRNVYTTVKMGVPAKGMISWQLVFTPKQIQEIASFVLSLHGTSPAAAKKPEGTLYVEQPDTSGATVAAGGGK
jgi:cytochrome c oxidase cbb3-type subunit III